MNSFLSLSFWFIMCALKRDSAMADLSWPPSTRPPTIPEAPPASMPGTTRDCRGLSHHVDPADTPMTHDDIGDEVFPPQDPTVQPPTYAPAASDTPKFGSASAFMPGPAPAPSPPWSYHNSSYELPISNHSRERTVHTIHFKIWHPDSPQRSLYIQEINQHGHRREFEFPRYIPGHHSNLM